MQPIQQLFATLAALTPALATVALFALAWAWVNGHDVAPAAALRRWWLGRRAVRIQVLIAHAERRNTLERALRGALRQLCQALGPDFPGSDTGLVVVAQQAIWAVSGQQQLASRSQFIQSGDHRWVLIRLALNVGGRERSTDEVLAALVEHCVALRAGPRQPAALRGVEGQAPAAAPPRDSAAGGGNGGSGSGEETILPPDPLAPLAPLSPIGAPATPAASAAPPHEAPPSHVGLNGHPDPTA